MVALIIALLENPGQAAEVKGCLERAGHGVMVVDSFARAMAILQDHLFDLIISDVHLENGGSVFDFLKWVKTNEHLRTTPFVLFSLEPTRRAKYLEDGVRTAARQLGANKYISMERFDAALFAEEIAKVVPDNPINPVLIVAKNGE